MISPSGVGGALPRSGRPVPDPSGRWSPSGFLRRSVIPTTAISTPAISRIATGLKSALSDESSLDEAGALLIGAGAGSASLASFFGCAPSPFPESPPPPPAGAAPRVSDSVVAVSELLLASPLLASPPRASLLPPEFPSRRSDSPDAFGTLGRYSSPAGPRRRVSRARR